MYFGVTEQMLPAYVAGKSQSIPPGAAHRKKLLWAKLDKANYMYQRLLATKDHEIES